MLVGDKRSQSVSGYGLKGRGSISSRNKTLSLFHSFPTDYGAYQTSIKLIAEAFSAAGVGEG
jgi:hypothetical protein